MFKGRNLLIASKHQKEKVIAPTLEKELGVECFVAHNFDTDTLGTFTGEIDRIADSVTTVRIKCLKAMELSSSDLAIASEGSFGPHPSNFYIHADEEILCFIDKKNDLEIIVQELSSETNYSGKQIENEHQLQAFATAVKFPSHGVILRKAIDDFSDMLKGITDWETLNNAFKYYISSYGMVYAETDMRALFNPTRMKVIENATKILVEKINSRCPNCGTPGFGITHAKRGLPCKLCGSSTRSTLSYLYSCLKCTFSKEEMFPNNKITEDPMYCDNCNP